MTPNEFEWTVKLTVVLGIFLGGYYIWRLDQSRFRRTGFVGDCPECKIPNAPHYFTEGKERLYCICEKCGHYNDDYADQAEKGDPV